MGLFDFLKKKELEQITTLKFKLERYQSISDIEQEVTNKKKELNELISKKETEFNNIVQTKSGKVKDLESNINALNTSYQAALVTYTKIRKEVSIFESKLDLIEFGIYEPVFDFGKSDDYRIEQKRIIEEQKSMIRLDKAAVCDTKWTVANSEAKGNIIVSRFKKLMLRAFNGECDVLIAKVKWNNVNQMKE